MEERMTERERALYEGSEITERRNQMAEVIKKEKEVILKDVISFEDYKKQVCDCLLKYQNYTIQEAENLLKEYETELPDFYEENCKPEVAACGMATRYL